MLSKLGHEAHDRHHMFDTLAGSVLLFYRLFLVFMFLMGIAKTYKYANRKEVKLFLLKFIPPACGYLLSLPALVLFVNWYVAPRNRLEYLWILVETVKIICNISMSYMFTSENSGYTKVKY